MKTNKTQISLDDLELIKVGKHGSTKTFTLTSAGFYINKNFADELNFDFSGNIVAFEHSKITNCVILISVDDDLIPQQWKLYIKKFVDVMSRYKDTRTKIGYRLHHRELMKLFPHKYFIDVEQTKINGFNALICKLIKTDTL